MSPAFCRRSNKAIPRRRRNCCRWCTTSAVGRGSLDPAEVVVHLVGRSYYHSPIVRQDPPMMNPLLFQRIVVFAFTILSVIPAAARAGDAAFDAWAEELAAQAVRDNPEAATRAQYFSGDEQDALDRRLTP